VLPFSQIGAYYRGVTSAGSGDEASGTKAVERLVSIMTVLAEEGRPLGIGEVAEGAGLPQATAHRLLNAFVATGWVDKDPSTSRYRIGNGILGPAAVALAHAPLIERGQPIIDRMAEVANMTSVLAVLVGRNVVYLARSSPTHAVSSYRAGMTRPAHCSASGKAMLAFRSPEERARLFRGRRQLRQFTPNTITEIEELEKHLDQARRNGYAVEHGEFREYQHGIAVPIHDASGRVIAAMSCTGHAESLTAERIAFLREEMAVLGEELSRQAGLGSD
jgi:DNA-binding IclR family transcriptional regulator